MRRCYFNVLVITLISVMFISACSSREGLSKDGYSKTEQFIQAQQIALEDALINFEKINDASVNLLLDDEKKAANIVLTVSEVIDATETDSIIQFISKSVENLEKEDIQIKDQDSNTIYPISQK